MIIFLLTVMGYSSDVEKIEKFSVQSSFLFSDFTGMIVFINICENY